MEKSSVNIIAMPSNKMHKMQEYIHLLFALDNVTSRLCLYYFRWTKVTEPKWDYELPPPFRHLNGGNVGTCCADVGQNFGVLAWWTQPPKPQCWKQVPNYVSDILVLTLWFGWLGPSVIVFGFLFWLCPGCGWGDGKGEVQAKTPLLRIIFSIFGLSKQFSDRILIRLWIGCYLLDLWLGTSSLIGYF